MLNIFPSKKDSCLETFCPSRILVCQLRQIGDVVLSTPTVELLKKRFPKSKIDIFTEKKCAPVYQNNPFINTIWVLDKSNRITQTFFLYKKIIRKGYDLVIDLQQLPRCKIVVAMSKAKVRLTYKPPWYNRVLYTHWSTPPPCYAATHKVALLGHLGITWNQERPKIFLNKSEIRDAKKFLTEHGVTKDNILITIDPTHRRPTRRWPTKHYAKLIAMISELRSDVRFFLLCGPGEENVLQTIVQFQNNVKTCILPNKVLSLREMAAIIHQADHHIGNCSAPRHFAVAVGTPSTTILGSTSTKWTYPDPMTHTHIRKGLSCQPCNKDICPKGNIECLNQLKPSEIIDFIMQRLKHKHCYDDTYT